MAYYYMDGINQNGPFKQWELLQKELPPDTPVFNTTTKEWSPFKELFENAGKSIYDIKHPKSDYRFKKQQSRGKVLEPNPNNTARSPKRRKWLNFLLVWTSLHILIFIFSSVEFPGLVNSPDGKERMFWPIVDYVSTSRFMFGNSIHENKDFLGIFHGYDYTELIVYVGAAWFLFGLLKLNNKV